MAWAKNGSTTLSSTGDTITVSSLTANKTNQFLLHALESSSLTTNHNLTFNNNSGSVYARRIASNGNADTTSVNRANIPISNASYGEHLIVMYVCSVPNEEKLMMSFSCAKSANGAGNVVSRDENFAKFVPSPDANITRVDINNSYTGDYASGSNLSALGSELTPASATTIETGSIYIDTDTNARWWFDGTYWNMQPTYQTDFSSNTGWTQTGSNITINTGTNSLTWIGDRTTSSHGLHYDLGSGIVSSKWLLEFDFVLDNYSAGTASYTHHIGVMLTDVDSTVGTYGSDATRKFVGMRLNWRTDTASQQRKFYIVDDEGGTEGWSDNPPYNTPDDSTAQSFPSAGTTYHMKLIKDGSSHSLQIWNSSQTSLLDTLNGSNSTTADIRYILVQSYNLATTDGNPNFDGKIQNMKFYNGVTSVQQ